MADTNGDHPLEGDEWRISEVSPDDMATEQMMQEALDATFGSLADFEVPSRDEWDRR